MNRARAELKRTYRQEKNLTEKFDLTNNKERRENLRVK